MNKNILKQIKDIKALIKEGKYLEAQEIYGQDMFDYAIGNQRKKDIDYIYLNKKLKGKAKLKFIKEDISNLLKSTGIVLAACPFLCITTFSILTEEKINNDNIVYENELKEASLSYINDAKSYIKNDLYGISVPLKMIDDMWENGVCYGNESTYNDVSIENLNLSIYDTGEGVCRHLSADLAKRMNEYSKLENKEDYGAILTTCEISDTKMNSSLKKRTIKESNNTVMGEEKKESKLASITENVIGNHAIVLFKSGDYIFYADPTNPNIGIVKGFNCYQYVGGEWIKTNEIKVISEKIVSSNDTNDTLNKYIALSMFTELTDELGNMVSIEKQNELLEEMKSLDTTYTRNNVEEINSSLHF